MLTALKTFWYSHQSLPRFNRIQWFVPATVVLIAFNGFCLTLPSGPLCDEGMVLFMEGGCDWGESNVFFHSKLSLLLVVNAAFILAWLKRTRNFIGYVPHYVLALWLAWDHRDGGLADTYYSHPNGSIGQMIMEIIAFSIGGLAILHLCAGRSRMEVVPAVAAWNLGNVGVFYFWLLFFDHWEWVHTLSIFASWLLFALVVWSIDRGDLIATMVGRDRTTAGIQRP